MLGVDVGGKVQISLLTTTTCIYQALVQAMGCDPKFDAGPKGQWYLSSTV